MTREEAWKIIESCKGWNTGQKSTSYAFDKVRTEEDDIYDARRKALKEAWIVVHGETTDKENKLRILCTEAIRTIDILSETLTKYTTYSLTGHAGEQVARELERRLKNV